MSLTGQKILLRAPVGTVQYDVPLFERRLTPNVKCFSPISQQKSPRVIKPLPLLLSSVALVTLSLSILAASLGGSTKIVSNDRDPKGFISSLSYLPAKNIFLSELSSNERKLANNKISFIKEIINKVGSRKESEALARTIVLESLRAKYDPLLVAAVIHSESTFRHIVQSNKGAVGLMQIIPTTAKFTAERNGMGWEGSHKLYDPQYNVQLGIRYLKYLEESFGGNMRQALIAYNWGPANLIDAIKSGKNVPSSVQGYADKILTRQERWLDQFHGHTEALLTNSTKLLG